MPDELATIHCIPFAARSNLSARMSPHHPRAAELWLRVRLADNVWRDEQRVLVDGVLSGVADQAGAALAAADGALEAAAGLGALAGLADFGNVDNPLTPLTDQVGSLSGVGDALSAALGPLRDLA